MRYPLTSQRELRQVSFSVPYLYNGWRSGTERERNEDRVPNEFLRNSTVIPARCLLDFTRKGATTDNGGRSLSRKTCGYSCNDQTKRIGVRDGTSKHRPCN